jgi:hypothetical protein
MIDPQTLNAGDVVVFGKTIEKTVRSVTVESDEHGYLFSEVQLDHGTEMFGDDPLWQIAELKKLILPCLIGIGFRLRDNVKYEYTGVPASPETLLSFCREAVKKLEEAGVKESK